eukprot:3190458-Pyramimonas_sp.AAC.2
MPTCGARDAAPLSTCLTVSRDRPIAPDCHVRLNPYYVSTPGPTSPSPSFVCAWRGGPERVCPSMSLLWKCRSTTHIQ